MEWVFLYGCLYLEGRCCCRGLPGWEVPLVGRPLEESLEAALGVGCDLTSCSGGEEVFQEGEGLRDQWAGTEATGIQ